MNNRNIKTEPGQPLSLYNNDPGIFPNVSHSKWMTEIWPEIADLKIHHLLLPSTHNAGADQQRLWGIEETLAACQLDTFGYQLANGACVLDLRIADFSYNKPAGKNSVRLIEHMGFEHFIDTGRRLENCVASVKEFATNNPLELVILSIESFKTGKIKDSTGRCQRYLAPLNGLLIPPSAEHMTLRQIRESHPGRNVIIAAPDSIRTGNYWRRIYSMWAGVDASLRNLERYTTDCFKNVVMGSLSINHLWIFQAHARAEGGGPLRLTQNSRYFKDFYEASSKKGVLANIINVDFFAGTGVVDFCIRVNQERGKQYPYPNTPTDFSATQVELTEQVKLTWTAPTNAPANYYEISVNGTVAATPHSTTGILERVYPDTYTYKVRTVDALDRRSEYSPELTLIVKDIAPPSTPGSLELTDIRMNSATLKWTPSYDVVGIKQYEIKRDGEIEGYTKQLFYPQTVLDRSTEYLYEVRAKDNSDWFSAAASITLQKRPGPPVSPSFTIDEPEWSAGKHLGVLEWRESYTSDLDYDYQIKILPDTIIYSAKTKLSHWMLVDEGVVYTIEIRAHLKGSDDLSAPVILTYGADSVPPGEVTGLTAQSIDNVSTTFTWLPATGRVYGYALSINEDSPFFVANSPCDYTTDKLVTGQSNTCEVWAINAGGIPGELASVSITPIDKQPPTKPGLPTLSEITSTSVKIMWASSTDNVAVTEYLVSINNQTFAVNQTSHTVTGLKQGTAYTVSVVASDAAGNLSPSATSDFSTVDTEPPTKPGLPTFSEITTTSAKVTWTSSTDNVAVTGYLISIDDRTITVTGTSHTATGLRQASSYTVTVIAKDAAGNLSPAASGNFKTMLAKPRNFNFNHVGGIGRLTWTAVLDQEVTYQILVNDVDVSAGSGVFFASFRLRDVPPGPVYRMKIRARKDAYFSEYTELVETVADWSRPGNPGMPIATQVTETSTLMSWMPSSSTHPLKGYRISVNGLFLGIVNQTSYQLDSMLGGVHHFFSLRAQDTAGNLSDGMVGGFKTLGDSPQPPPGKPQDLRVITQTPDSISLAWNKGQGEGVALGYRIASDNELVGGISFSTEKTITDVIPGIKYFFQVRGYDLYGQVSEPAEISVTVNYPPEANSPRNFKMLNSGLGWVKIGWDVPSESNDLIGYLVNFKSNFPKISYRTNQTSLLPGLLLPRTRYDIEVCAEYSDGTLSRPLNAEATTG